VVRAVINYTINGGKELYGEVQISGAKNAVLGVIAAALLADSPCRIENVPKVSDVCTMLEIVRDLGANVKLINSDTVEIDPSGFSCRQASPEAMELMREMRASYYIVGVQLGLFGKAIAAMPGGCDLGSRPIDRHIKGFEALGASIEVKNGYIYGTSSGKLHGAQIYFDDKSVGATINLMLAAA
jgi:UDP-N-acetylglucosamine 1-carboxyvinyltransferase